MRAELYLIPDCPLGRLAIMPRPRAGDWLVDEAISWREQGMDGIVSLLEDAEIDELGLVDEAENCRLAGLWFARLPIPDRGVPFSNASVSTLVATLVADLSAGRGIGIHCRIGVGRSALLATCVLAALGWPLERAWSAVAAARGLSVPDTDAQREWVCRWLVSFQTAAKGSTQNTTAADLSQDT